MRLLYTILLLSALSFGQDRNGISYQALILNPIGESLPGKDNDNTPLVNTDICLQFHIINSSGTYEYSESQTLKTDEYGMVNLVIGTGTPIASINWDALDWSAEDKSLRVNIDFSGTCSNFTLLSNQKLNYTPYSYYAVNSGADSLVAALEDVVDANESASDTADTTLQTNIDAVQADVDANETAANTAIADVQADVDANESASDTADTTLQTNIDAVQSDVDQNETAANTALNLKANLASPSFTGTPLAPTASAGTSTTQIATTAFVDSSVSTGVSGLAAVREVADEFSATANQTSFTLTQEPSTNSKVRMYLNGIRISNTAYNISGTTLTYDPDSNGSYSLNTSDRIQFDYYY